MWYQSDTPSPLRRRRRSPLRRVARRICGDAAGRHRSSVGASCSSSHRRAPDLFVSLSASLSRVSECHPKPAAFGTHCLVSFRRKVITIAVSGGGLPQSISPAGIRGEDGQTNVRFWVCCGGSRGESRGIHGLLKTWRANRALVGARDRRDAGVNAG